MGIANASHQVAPHSVTALCKLAVTAAERQARGGAGVTTGQQHAFAVPILAHAMCVLAALVALPCGRPLTAQSRRSPTPALRPCRTLPPGRAGAEECHRGRPGNARARRPELVDTCRPSPTSARRSTSARTLACRRRGASYLRDLQRNGLHRHSLRTRTISNPQDREQVDRWNDRRLLSTVRRGKFACELLGKVLGVGNVCGHPADTASH